MTSGRERAELAGPIGYTLAVASRTHRAELQQRLSEIGLYLGQELLIVDLDANPGSTQAELVDRLRVEQPTVAKTLARLERAGFVTRADDPHDRRINRVHLTEGGRAAVSRIAAAWADADAAVSGLLTEKERHTLVRLLDKLASSAPSRL